jgi:Uma2 family endonuclease
MATESSAPTIYDELALFPEDDLRREIIDGELLVTPAPGTRHQEAVGEMFIALQLHARRHGGRAYVAPTDVFFSDGNVVEPDVLFILPEHLSRIEPKYINGAPDIVVEVSSPSSHRIELVQKLELYERFSVPEYWYVDLQADRIEIHRLVDGRYAVPTLLRRGDVLRSKQVPGFERPVDDILGPDDPERDDEPAADLR